MASAPMPADADALVLSRRKTEKDLKVSEGMLIAGVVLYIISFVLAISGAYSQFENGFGFFAIDILSGMASVFILIGAIFTGINWWLLRKGRAHLPK
jgi:hypothetical protein